jgi:multidrug efflux pump subunit AcrB
MKKFNLSEWALDHRSFVAYLMIVFLVAGVYSYLKLGATKTRPLFSTRC